MGVIVVKDFNLDLTVKSGQFFYYEELGENEFLLINGLDLIKVKQQGEKLIFTGSEEKLRELLGLTNDYELFIKEVKKLAKKDLLVKRALKNFNGLRIMSQDLHQAIITFICSSNTNMKKIKKNVFLLSEKFGEKIQGKNEFSFPKINSLNDLEKIKSCSTGYRAKYLHKANELLTKEFLNKVKKANYEEAKELLMTISGVGPKVADCICLFSLKKYEAFPIDVWIKRVMINHYGKKIKKPHTEKNILEFAKKHFGNYAGYIQQYLFLEIQRESKEEK